MTLLILTQRQSCNYITSGAGLQNLRAFYSSWVGERMLILILKSYNLNNFSVLTNIGFYTNDHLRNAVMKANNHRGFFVAAFMMKLEEKEN